eukprot:TRINITY_DN2032_c0_g1_i3.p2 TRINITY_DN2032_c0_g1~~TRINITY_DN2032_c0_g1_i3.p2  ORF type:complete len:206 (+),score=21.18 TRINITY_DN2032_c0_g1_i3:683-1300(+)
MGLFTADPYASFIQEVMIPKVSNNFGVNLLRGIPCNMLVCTAICIANTAEDVVGKVVGVWWPIFTFALAGFEHSIANMFFATLAALHGASWNYGTWFWQNLIAVLIGNTIGGGLFVAVVMWRCFYVTGKPPVVVQSEEKITPSGATYTKSPAITRKNRPVSDLEVEMAVVKVEKSDDIELDSHTPVNSSAAKNKVDKDQKDKDTI